MYWRMKLIDTEALPLLLTPQQAIAVSNIQRTMLFGYMARGRLERVKLGRATRIVTASLLRLVAELPRY
jgi:hypothetical protein